MALALKHCADERLITSEYARHEYVSIAPKGERYLRGGPTSTTTDTPEEPQEGVQRPWWRFWR